MGVRPEGTGLVGQRRHPVVVDVIEELGGDRYLYCSTPETEGDLGASRAITVRRDASSDHVGGEQLNLQPQLHAVHLFDAVTGRRLPDAVVPALRVITPAGLEPFPLSRWSSPALAGFGRLPMAPGLDPFDDPSAARIGRAVTVGAVARRALGVPPRRRPRPGDARRMLAPTAPPTGGASSTCPERGRCRATERRPTSTWACRSRTRRRRCRRPTRPGSTGGRAPVRLVGGASAHTARRGRELVGSSGSTAWTSGSARTVASPRPSR